MHQGRHGRFGDGFSAFPVAFRPRGVQDDRVDATLRVMTSTRSRLGAIVVLTTVLVCLWVSWYLNRVSDRPVHGPNWTLGLIAGVVSVTCGAIAWHRRPDTAIGRRLVIAGLLVFAEALLRSNDGWLFTIGNVVVGASGALLAHIVVTYPSGRAESLLERSAVIAGYAVFAAFLLARATTTDFAPTCASCPVNHFYVGGYPRLFDALNGVAVALVVALVIAVAISLVVKWQAASRALRRVLAPPYASALLIVSVVVLARPGFDDRGPSDRRDLIVGLAILTFPIALSVGLLRGHLARAAASDLLVELGGEPSLEAAAARSLGDPTVTLWSWHDASRMYQDDAGRSFIGPAPPGRQLAVIERDGRRLGALECDAALAEEPQRLTAVVAAIGLALDRQRLTQEVQERLAEVASSRTRIVTAADDERRRIERNLHDGAQQRLVGVLMLLRRAHTRAAARGDDDVTQLLDQAVGEVDRSLAEIRKLARGLQPPLLEERGLSAALDALGESSGVATAVSVQLEGRPPRAVETAAYFVVSECIANIAKHAGATSASIAVHQEGGRVVVQVSDDGAGRAAITPGGGLGGLCDRVEALGGVLDVRSVPGRGTTVTARLPIMQ